MDIFGNQTNLSGDKKARKVVKKPELSFAVFPENDDAIPEPIKTEEKRSNLLYLKIFTILIFGAILCKLFYSQIIFGKVAEGLALGNKIRPRLIPAVRGLILDDKGVWLARNTPTFDLAIYPSDLPKVKNDRELLYQKVAAATGLNAADIEKTAEANGLYSLDAVSIKENLSHDEALLMEEKINNLPAFFVMNRASRQYGTIPGLSHLLGYTGKVSESDLQKQPNYQLSDYIGKTGLESSYEEYLKGQDGVEQIEVDSSGNIVRSLVDSNNREPVAGDNITLNIDSDLQAKSAESLLAGIVSARELTGDQSIDAGVVIAMDPKTGGILSMVSLPAYDDNLFANGISAADYQKLASDPSQPLFNRATSGTYPPGSISKIILASAGLAEGNITASTSFVTPAAIQIGDFNFPDWKDHSYESTNVERALAESNNVFFYSVGGGFDKIKGLGIDKIKKWWQNFGLGEKTGIDLPSESSGLLPDGAWKKKVRNEGWYIGDTYHVSIGQGDLLITPLQMVRAVAAIANGGQLLNPQLVSKITDPDGNVIKEFGPRVENPQVAPASVIQTVQQGMRMAVTDGSARGLQALTVTSAGKTGTAQFFNNQKTHAWFEAYAPYDNPQIAIIVMVEGGGGGHEIALPVAQNILNYYFTR